MKLGCKFQLVTAGIWRLKEKYLELFPGYFQVSVGTNNQQFLPSKPILLECPEICHILSIPPYLFSSNNPCSKLEFQQPQQWLHYCHLLWPRYFIYLNQKQLLSYYILSIGQDIGLTIVNSELSNEGRTLNVQLQVRRNRTSY